ncbi:MAG: GGDEF domain-containing protein [Betaproteobacteria bacterium]|nr:GGDEF domain-containing protein [Betaproteobacteria bacterium]
MAQPLKSAATLTEQEAQIRLRAAAFVGIGLPALIYFGISASLAHEWPLTILALTTIISVIISSALLWRRRGGYAAIRPAVACHTVLMLYLLVFSGPEHARGLWFLTLPLVSIMLLPPEEGSIWAFGSTAIGAYLMQIAGGIDGSSPYTNTYIVRFIILAVLISGVLTWSEILLQRYRLRLLAQNAALTAERDQLEKEIVQRGALEEELRYLATTDPLTGLLNRRAFMATLSGELTRSQRLHNRFTLLMLDIDHFKRVNDTYGHPTGDAVLVHLALLLSAQLRSIDKLARIGGEEFAIMLIDTRADAATGVIERLLQAIRSKPAEHPETHLPIAFTASIGCTESLPVDDELTALSRADRALYIAKQGGRDRYAWV